MPADDGVVDLASDVIADGDLRSLQALLQVGAMPHERVRQALGVIGEFDLDELVEIVMASLK